MRRRTLIQGGTLALGLAGSAWLGYRFWPPSASDSPADPIQLAARLLSTLSSEHRDAMWVDYDHPYRQYHNRGVWGGGISVARAGFDRRQLQLVADLMYAGLSQAGRSIVPEQFFLKLPDVLFNNLLICGEPGGGDCQVIFTGPHLNLRLGGRSREGVAFGGPQVYGDQRGNETPGLPGNVYRPQFQAGMELFDALSPVERDVALLPHSPIQTRIELKGRSGTFPGLPVAELAPGLRDRVRRMIDLTFLPYPPADVAYAWECLEANGGLERLSVSFYEDSAYPDVHGFQTYRLEGPAAVFYFRGFPHVHAFFNVAMDGDSPLSVGEVIGTNPELLEGIGLKGRFERALARQSGSDFGFYNRDSAVGFLRAGPVRTGDVYTAESWENTVVHVDIDAASIRGELSADLADRGVRLEPERSYRIATVDYVADEIMDAAMGSGRIVGRAGPLRELLIRDFREYGLSDQTRSV